MVGALIALIVLLAILVPKIGSNMMTYVLLALIVIVIIFTGNHGPSRGSSYMDKAKISKNDDGSAKLGEKEKKFLIYHLLTLVEKKEAVDMKDLAGELNISIYELNEIIKFLNKHEAITVMFPPMENFPIIRQGKPDINMKLRLSIYQALAKKNLLGEVRLEDFAKEVEDYLEGLKRPSNR